MEDQQNEGSMVTEGSILKVFTAYAVPSLISILCITTASIVDGLFVGRYVGQEALASLALLIPYFTLVFGVTLMLSVGGSVQASYHLGEGRRGAASALFSKIVYTVLIVAAVFVAFSVLGRDYLFASLQAEESMLGVLSEYMGVMGYALGVQMLGMVCYYFMRVAGKPQFGMYALLAGSLTNILLDWVFVGIFNWGVAGAAWATLVAQLVQLCLLVVFYVTKQETFRWVMVPDAWKEVWFCAKNGFSEFVNEISVGVVIYLVNFLMLSRHGVEGVAAFSVVNYLIFVSVMLTFGIVDGVPPLVGENMGAGKHSRVRGVMRMAFSCLLLVNGLVVATVLFWGDSMATLFLKEDSAQAGMLVSEILDYVWPIFLLHGANIAIALYLTGMRKPLHSASLAMSRSLVLPVLCVLGVFYFLPDIPFLLALPIAEGLTLCAAIYFYLKFIPTSKEGQCA